MNILSYFNLMMYGQRPSEEIKKHALETKALIVDLRSDTISKPPLAMRQAMFDAEVGDDVFEEDPTVKRLEEKAAKLLGKEAALFVSSGTMGNLISVMIHCDTRGCEIYCGSESHIVNHEQGGAAQIAGVTVCSLPNRPDGTFSLIDLESKLRSNWLHEPISCLVAVENTINGRLVPQEWINQLEQLVHRHNLKLHLDGARLWNASVASGRPACELARPFDSVTFCLSKGLAAPAGSVLCGSADFIRRARRARKVLGGGMRQVGVLAAAGIFALDEMVPLLRDDHRRASEIAKAINATGSRIFSVDLGVTHSNMIMIKVSADGVNGKSKVSARDFVARLQCVKNEADDDDRIVVRGLALSSCLARLAFYYEITDELTKATIRKINYVIREFERNN
ncbi:uncharacterized protein LOC106641637 isoform X2 [Copidosoma floridanum]|nr:uncharacterized protein LOC106641637 isoform X2 [Copidosoma floridanum]XP_014211616.1 uncharacterized protein LOC106641637 isoform X2 [Copidosoma floridanum]